MSYRSLALCLLTVFLTFDVGSAQVTSLNLLPDGLSPGDPFRYVFVTGGGRDTTSADIADYDQFVTNDANAAGSLFFGRGLDFQVIGSTTAVDAVDHIVSGGVPDVPFFLPGGRRVADNLGDFFDGSLINNIDINTLGVSVINTIASTGSLGTGVGYEGFEFGTVNQQVNHAFIDEGIEVGFSGVSSASESFVQNAFFGISSVVIAVPEPSSLLVFSFAGLGFASRRRRR